MQCWMALGAALLLLAPAAARAAETGSLEARQAETRSEYDRLSREVVLSNTRAATLAAEIATVRKDSATLTAALIETAARERALGVEIEAIVARLEPLKTQEAALRETLRARRVVLAQVLGALQRMGLNPPPALLVEPEDALSSVRSAILLSAVVPELRAEAEKLLADLDALSQATRAVEAERAKLGEAVAGQIGEKRKLEMLLAEKQRLADANQAALVEEQRRTEELAAKAGSLKELIAGLEKEKAETERRQLEEERAAQRRAELAARSVPEANRLARAAPFSQLRRQVSLPVLGRIARRYGSDDGNGGVMLGDMVGTQSGAIVTAPADGTVLYAGPFRSLGQLLILDAGDGYHLVLAGLDRINVAKGQSVLAGEPVGAMGETRIASIASLGNAAGPELYVEFRKDGKPVDPSPWWAGSSGRTGNGS